MNRQSNQGPGGILLPPGSVPPEKVLEANMRSLRVELAARNMAVILGRDVSGDPLTMNPQILDLLADTAVVCADALMRRLSEGPFALPINWEPSPSG